MYLTRVVIKLAFLGNIALILWVILELFKVPLQFVPGADGPSVLATYLFSTILLGMVANAFSALYLGLQIFRGVPISNRNLAVFNFVFFFIVLLYYALV